MPGIKQNFNIVKMKEEVIDKEKIKVKFTSSKFEFNFTCKKLVAIIK